MKTNENIRAEAPVDIIELGVASVETKGPDVGAEDFGTPIEQGITNE